MINIQSIDLLTFQLPQNVISKYFSGSNFIVDRTLSLACSGDILNLIRSYFYDNNDRLKDSYGWDMQILYHNIPTVSRSDIEYFSFNTFIQNINSIQNGSSQIIVYPPLLAALDKCLVQKPLLPAEKRGKFYVTKCFLICVAYYYGMNPVFWDGETELQTPIDFGTDYQTSRKLTRRKKRFEMYCSYLASTLSDYHASIMHSKNVIQSEFPELENWSDEEFYTLPNKDEKSVTVPVFDIPTRFIVIAYYFTCVTRKYIRLALHIIHLFDTCKYPLDYPQLREIGDSLRPIWRHKSKYAQLLGIFHSRFKKSYKSGMFPSRYHYQYCDCCPCNNIVFYLMNAFSSCKEMMDDSDKYTDTEDESSYEIPSEGAYDSPPLLKRLYFSENSSGHDGLFSYIPDLDPIDDFFNNLPREESDEDRGDLADFDKYYPAS